MFSIQNLFRFMTILSTMMLYCSCLVVEPSSSSSSYRTTGPVTEGSSSRTISRRALFTAAAGTVGIVAAFGRPEASVAFDNKISTQYDDRPKRRGPKPNDLGVLPRTDLAGEEYLGLKHCGAAPNCFCSTDSVEDDADHSIPAWIWPQDFGNDKEKAFIQLAEVIKAYKPGQSDVDGGGFQIITNDSKKGYIYTQFESLKNGYIDDLELAYIEGMGDRAVQVRSSSRVGYLDFGVNAKRLNSIAKDLRSRGWDAKGVDFDTHPNYAIQNELI